MSVEQEPRHPNRIRLGALITCCEKRVSRANEKLEAAALEQTDAIAAAVGAHEALAEWLAANPDPQLALPIGETNV